MSDVTRLADWCVPSPAMRWGHLTRGDMWIQEWDESDPCPPGDAPVIWYPPSMPAPTRWPTSERPFPDEVCPRCGSTDVVVSIDPLPPMRCCECGERWAAVFKADDDTVTYFG
jgi:hypothetical protein